MFEVPHMLAGEALGKVWPRARYALPAGLLSHFVLDAVPHREVTEIPGLSRTAVHILEPIGILGAVALVAGLAWHKPQRWVMWGAAASAILPDLLDYVHPIARYWKTLPFTPPLTYLHNLIQCSSRGFPVGLGIANQVVVIALALWILLRRDHPKVTAA